VGRVSQVGRKFINGGWVVDQLRKMRLEQLLGAVDAFIDAMRFSARGEEIWRFWSYRDHMRTYNELLETASRLVTTDIKTSLYDLDAVPAPGNTFAMQQKSYFDSVLVHVQILRALVQQQLGTTSESALDLANFISANLRRGLHAQPERNVRSKTHLRHCLSGRAFRKASTTTEKLGG
jgi:hypothetical protein